MADLSEIKPGDKAYYDARTDSTYEQVACSFHAGCEIVGSRPGVDEDTSTVIDEPIYSENVGYQPDCFGCRAQAYLTLEHVNAVEAHDMLAAQFHGVALRYGVSPNERAVNGHPSS